MRASLRQPELAKRGEAGRPARARKTRGSRPSCKHHYTYCFRGEFAAALNLMILPLLTTVKEYFILNTPLE
jgi:hypothetical protein